MGLIMSLVESLVSYSAALKISLVRPALSLVMVGCSVMVRLSTVRLFVILWMLARLRSFRVDCH